MEQIEWVGSHEQALGQCSAYLKANLPNARQVQFDSTARAAETLAAGHGDSPGAAICSKDLGDRMNELEVMATGIQNFQGESFSFLSCDDTRPTPLHVTPLDNYTRFLVLRRRSHEPSLPNPPRLTRQLNTTAATTTSSASDSLPPHPLVGAAQSRPGSTFLAVHSAAVLQDLPTNLQIVAVHSLAQVPDEIKGSRASSKAEDERYLVEAAGQIEEDESKWIVLGSS